MNNRKILSLTYVILFFQFIFSNCNDSKLPDDNLVSVSIARCETNVYKKEGNGKPIFVIGGLPGYGSNYLTKIIDSLSKSNQIYIINIRGIKKSECSYNFDALALVSITSNLDNLREALTLNEVSIFGHGFGGTIAMAYSVYYPNKLDKLILCNSSGFQPKHFETPLRLQFINDFEGYSAQRHKEVIYDSDEKLRTVLDSLFVYENLVNKSLTEEVYFSYITNNFFSEFTEFDIDINMKKRNPIDLSNGMKAFNEDVLILCGDKDNVSLPYAKSIAQLYPKNQLILIPNTKFFPWEDNPSFFYKSINNFMTDKKN